MTSKFFSRGNASDDSDDSAVEDNMQHDKARAKIRNIAAELVSGGKRDDEGGRKVLNEKDKKWEIMRTLSQKIKEKIKINDFVELLQLFQALQKELDKSIKIFEAEGYPSFLAKGVLSLIDHANQFKDKQKLNVTNSKSLNTLRQKLKKFEKEQSKQMQKLREVAKIAEEAKKDGNEEEESSDEFSEDNKSQEESEEDDKQLLLSDDPMERRKFWLKKKPEEDKKLEEEKDDKDKPEEEKDDKEKEKEKKKSGNTGNPDIPVVKKANLMQKKQKKANFSSEEAKRKLRQITSCFGKPISAEERQQFIEDIQNIKTNSKKDSERLSLMLIEIPLRIEASRINRK